MSSSANVLDVYKDLAACYERRGQAQMRDRFLVLAADAALASGQADEAERLRLRLLQANPHHMLKPYATFDQARTAPDVDTYVRNLRLNYPLEVAADLLRALHASDDPGVQQMQQTAALPPADLQQEMTLRLNVDDESVPSTTWNPTGDNGLEGTVADPHATATPPAPKRVVDVAETAHLPSAGAQRPRLPTKADVERTEAAPRAAPRIGPAPRSAAPSSVPPARPPSSSRPPAPKAPPRPAPGPSPFASLPNDPTAADRARYPLSAAETPEGNGWLASVLVVLVGLLGLVVAAYTIARPFLP